MQRFGTQFPSACATNGRYRLKANDDWTNGFWTGMLWLAYEWSHQENFVYWQWKILTAFNND